MATSMNYSRIIKFSVALFLILVFASTVISLLWPTNDGQFGVHFWGTQYIVSILISLIAYIVFARYQNSEPYKHAVLAASLCWVINIMTALAMQLLIGVQTLNETVIIDLAITILVVPLGTYIGVKLSPSKFD